MERLTGKRYHNKLGYYTKCSACGFEHYGCSIRNYHYCPNCGARMDLGGDGNA